MPPTPTIVCLCGSTRHKDLFLAAADHEARAGRIVLMPGVFSKADRVTLSGDELRVLGELHRRKLELADEILVIDAGARVGEDTAAEIRYATELGKPVRYWSAMAGTSPAAATPVDPVLALAESHRAQRLITNHTPTLDVPAEVKELRCALIEEEASEFRAALEAGDLVEVADAIADLLYVVYGAALTFGVPVKEVFAEVHRSNMTKLDDEGEPIYRGDGKVMKGPNFSPPDLLPILRSAGYRA
jgi:phosphoribosyl-ATP pyrophosphohydrolase